MSSELAEPQTVVEAVVEQSRRVLETYRIDAGLVQEHANSERRIFQGGYGDRQIYELIQNGADELRAQPGGEVHAILTSDHLYVANEGNPFTARGVETILRMGVSYKRGGQIGRFGVGVKSVLSITDSPEFYSKSGSFGFDREWSAEQIRAVAPDAHETPVLRMARPYDIARTAAGDPVLAELLAWASTVVRLRLKPPAVKRLAADLRRFPAQFLLFAPHVGMVVLEDRRPAEPFKRELFARTDGDCHTIQISTAGHAQDVTEAWRVFSRVHVPSDAARDEAGELHDRPEIDLSWAVPEHNLNRRGEFWAYFPTNYNTTLRGIVNAPWKTSEDRQNLFDGNSFNTELIREAADLIVTTLPKLSPADDPGAYLTLLPGRGREAAQWADKTLTDLVYQYAASRPSLPDQHGVFRRPAELKLHPEKLEEKWLELWAGHDGRPTAWCHHSVEQRERRAKAELIRENAQVETATVCEWLEALVSDESAEASARAIRIMASMHCAGRLDENALKARVVLTELHGFVAPVRGAVFRRADADGLQENLAYVASSVVDFDHETLRALEDLGIREAHAEGRFESVVEQGFTGYTEDQWGELWAYMRKVGPHSSISLLQKHDRLSGTEIKVRTASGEFRRAAACLLPGAVVPADGSRDARIAVDLRFHAEDRVLLEAIGLKSIPSVKVDPRTEEWFAEYMQIAYDSYLKSLPANSPRPQSASLQLEGADPAGPLHLLTELSETGRAAFVAHLPAGGVVASWTMHAGTRGKKQILSPLAWMVGKYGLVMTSRGIRRPSAAVGPDLGEFSDVLPVAQISGLIADGLGLATSLEQVPERMWREVLLEVAESRADEFPGRAYALILRSGFSFPGDVLTRCRVGDEWGTRPDNEIAVAIDRAEYETLIREGIPALLAPSTADAELMTSTWGMRRLDEVIEKELRYAADADPITIIDEFPYLRIRSNAKVAGWSVLRCGELERLIRTPTGLRTEELASAVTGQVVLVRSPEDDLDVLRAIDRELKLGLGRDGCKGVLDQRERQREDARLQKARRAHGDAAKLAELLDLDTIRRGLPPGLVESDEAERGCSATLQRAAELAVNAYGDEVLRYYKEDLDRTVAEGMGDLRASARSRQAVADLGFSAGFAGAKTVTLPEIERVDGPTEYPKLHAYQEQIVTAMVGLVRQQPPARAMLCLPTGAGKTRVASEAVIRVLSDNEIHGPVLWIAQTQELCEQAVQSWKFVWSKVGPERQLTISRLWSTNEATAVDAGPHLVVATDAKLEKCLDLDTYTWLRRAALVIVDEAHTSVSPRYTQILKSLGLTSSVTRRPLIGLTATPYRPGPEETHRLVERYGRSRLDDGVFDGDPYQALQELGMLAEVEHRLLSGADLTLNAQELGMLSNIGGLLPASAEKRLAGNEERTKRILDEILAFPEDWPVLLFATSVDHARVLAARLNDRKVKAAAVDAGTPASDRRARIDGFRAGKIRVLANYGVLAQGFDAPATRAVVVARPTYSPNVYQQMIGRGLRGPKNGGKDTCLILNVQDNITNYGEALAFTAFEHLWAER